MSEIVPCGPEAMIAFVDAFFDAQRDAPVRIYSGTAADGSPVVVAEVCDTAVAMTQVGARAVADQFADAALRYPGDVRGRDLLDLVAALRAAADAAERVPPGVVLQ